MSRKGGNFYKHVWQSAMQFQKENPSMNNDLHEFLQWICKQANDKDVYRWANAINNYAADRYTVETFVKGRNVVVYVSDDEAISTFCRGSAHCNKNDHFDSNVGRAIALYRALRDLGDVYDTDFQDDPEFEPPFDI